MENLSDADVKDDRPHTTAKTTQIIMRPVTWGIFTHIFLQLVISQWNQKNQKSNFRYSRDITPNRLARPSARLSAWATQLPKNLAAVASRWRHCADLTSPIIKPQTSGTDSVSLTTKLTHLNTKFGYLL